MIIAFDAQNLRSDAKTGIGYYTENVINSLTSQYKKNDYCFNFFERRFSYTLWKTILIFIPLPYAWFFKNKADVYHFFNYFVPPFVSGKTVLTIYDMVLKDYPDTVRLKTKIFMKLSLGISLKRADVIVVISEFVKQRLMHHYPHIADKPITVIPCGVDFNVYKKENDNAKTQAIKQKYGIDRDYFLFVGTIEPRKNLERLIDAYGLLCKECEIPPRLVLAGGKGWLDAGIFAALERIPAKHAVIQTGYIPQAEIPTLMSASIAFCFPSVYEGFGMPVLEAMACKTPVLTSNIASMPEITGEAALLVDPYNLQEIKDGLLKCYRDKTYSQELGEKGYVRAQQFSWDDIAKKLMNIYREQLPYGT